MNRFINFISNFQALGKNFPEVEKTKRNVLFFFSLKLVFEGKYSIQKSASTLFFFVLKLPVLRQFYWRAVSTLLNKNLWTSNPAIRRPFYFFWNTAQPVLFFLNRQSRDFSIEFRLSWQVGTFFFKKILFLTWLKQINFFSIVFTKLLKKYFDIPKKHKKSWEFINLSKKLTKLVNIRTFFSVFGYKFFSNTLVSRES